MLFELPETLGPRLKIINSLPRDWAAMRAKLWAPQQLYQEKRIAYNTELHLNSHGNKIEIKGQYVTAWEERDWREDAQFNRGQTKCDVLDLITKDKNVALVSLDYVGWNGEPMTFPEAVDLVYYFTEKGYKGFIEAYSSYDYSECIHLKHARIDINHAMDSIEVLYPDEGERRNRLGDFLIELHTIQLQEKRK